MKRSSYIYLFAFFIAALGVYQYFHTTVSSPYYSKDKPHLNICRTAHKVRGASFQPLSLNYRGSSLVSNSTDPEDLVLCPGDAFGDLNGTYMVLHDCYLAMYHQENLIWSSKRGSDEAGVCAISLQKDGNLVLYKESMTCFGYSQDPITCLRYPQHPVIWAVWDSRTDYYPNKTEMRIQGQQLQVIHTLKDGSQRLFFTGENIREFQEDMGTPKQVAKKSLIIDHTDVSDVILRRNEYIGDLNGIDFILQTNCELQLRNNYQTIWSFAAYLKPDERCTLNTQGNSIGISKIPMRDYRFEGMSILPQNDFTVIQSNITLQGDQLLIIQTLKNGSEIIFYNEPGQDNGLKLKRELRQISNNINNLPISSKLILERLDYIGDLDGLHLILRDNCVLTLANGQQELWKLQESLDGPFMECYVQFKEDGTIMFNLLKNNDETDQVQIFGKRWTYRSVLPSQFQLSLENNAMILNLEYLNKTAEIYHANANTNGTWFQALSSNFSSFTVDANDTNDKIFPQRGYIGDINGVYVVLNRDGNWILSNKSQVIWESGTTEKYNELILTRDGNLALSYEWATKDKDYFLWSTYNITTMNSVKQTPLSTTELLVNNDGLWLIHNYSDGTVRKFKAQQGTNNFALMPNENEAEVSPPSQIYKL